MTMINPFTSDAFRLISLTRAINILPNQYGRLNEMNLMPGRGVTTRSIMVEEQAGVLNLLQTQPVGSPGTVDKRPRRTVRSFVVPHIPHDDVILPDEYNGIRAFGTENAVDTLSLVMNQHLQRMRNKHAITLENLRMGALKGIIQDADGSTLYNLYDEFNIVQHTQAMSLSTSTTNVSALCRNVVRWIEDHLLGEIMTGVYCLCSPEFFDDLIEHSNVEKFFLNYAQAAQLTGQTSDPRKGFTFGGITFEEYRGFATDAAGNVRRFIAAGEAHCFPLGTSSAFETIFAPADFVETANTIGLELYAKQEPREFGRGVDIHTQSNPLPICNRPGLLVKLTA